MIDKKIIYIKCPTCAHMVEWNECSLHRPFCSKRCQLIDLGTWANEEHRIPNNPDLDREIGYDNMGMSFEEDHK